MQANDYIILLFADVKVWSIAKENKILSLFDNSVQGSSLSSCSLAAQYLAAYSRKNWFEVEDA